MLDKIGILTLSGLPGIGRNTINLILKSIHIKPYNIKEFLELLKFASELSSRVKVPEESVLQKSYDNALKTVEKCCELNIKILSINDDGFPLRLKYIPEPPVLLYAKGNINCLNEEMSVAIIGTREPSKYGVLCGERFSKYFSEKGLIIVSGLAKGIDTVAHKGCLDSKGKTVAVLAQGLNTGIYPSENRTLAQQIIDEEGCWISEYGLGERGRPNYFIERDRLQAGLSAGVVVIETDIKGGTMHTVRFCLEQNKPLGCLNHPEKFSIDNKKARGNIHLINQGKATPLFSTVDIDSFISIMDSVTTFYKKMEQLKVNVKVEKPAISKQMKLF